MRPDVPALFHGRGIFAAPGIEMTLLCLSQSDFGVGFRLPISSCSRDIWARQNVAVRVPRRGANCSAALSTVAIYFLGSLSDLVKANRGGKAIASFDPVLCCSSAKLRSHGLPKSGAIAKPGHPLSRLRCSIHAALKVSSCAALTQSRNNGNNLQLSEVLRRSVTGLRRSPSGNDASSNRYPIQP
jgi:hypothetical protein